MNKIQSIENIPYVQRDGESLHLDIHRPAAASAPLPVVMFLPGGGWRNCPRDPAAEFLVNAGFAEVSVMYRVSGRAIAPANIHDCKAAVRWVRSHAKEYGLDPQRIGAWGASAGGHLSALLGLAGGRKELMEKDVGTSVSDAIQAACDFCGPSDLTRMARPDLRQKLPALYEVTEQYLGGPVEKRIELARQMSPLQYVSSSAPPMLIIHGEADDIVPVEESVLLHDALRKAGADSTLRVLPREGHSWNAELTNEDVVSFFKRTLRA